MSNVFDEIADDLRREKLTRFWRENGSWIVGGIVLAVVLTAVLSFWRQWEHKRDMAATAELSRVAALNDRALLEQFAAGAPQDQAMIARMIAAAAYADAGEVDKAVALYTAVAAEKGIDSTYRDLATLYSVNLRADSADAALLRQELAPLVVDKAPWRYTALELDALLAAKQGEMAAAVAALAKIAADPAAPADARARAFTLRELYVAEQGGKQ